MASSRGRFIWYELTTTDMAGANAFSADLVGSGTQDLSVPETAYRCLQPVGLQVFGNAVLTLPRPAR